MKKIFISQPMRGKTDEEIKLERNAVIDLAKSQFGDIEVLDTFFQDFDGRPLEFIAKSIEMLSQADVAIFAPNWEDARGCRIERQCCDEYGVPTIVLLEELQ
jgi:hypothetical protein